MTTRKDCCHWTAYDNRMLGRLAQMGVRSEDIGLVMNRTGNAVRQRARRMGIALTPRGGQPHVIRRAVLLDLFMEHPGASLAFAGRVLGRARQTVGVMAQKLARDGLLRRVSWERQSFRYLVTAKWRDGRKKESA